MKKPCGYVVCAVLPLRPRLVRGLPEGLLHLLTVELVGRVVAVVLRATRERAELRLLSKTFPAQGRKTSKVYSTFVKVYSAITTSSAFAIRGYKGALSKLSLTVGQARI